MRPAKLVGWSWASLGAVERAEGMTDESDLGVLLVAYLPGMQLANVAYFLLSAYLTHEYSSPWKPGKFPPAPLILGVRAAVR